MPCRFLVFVCGAVCATAQPTSLSLDDAIRRAWAVDPSVAAFELEPEIARAREEQAGLRPNPEVEVRGGVPVKGDSEWSVGVGVSQRLPRRERTERAQALARLGGVAAGLHRSEQRRVVAGEVRRLAYEAAVLAARRELARRMLAEQRELLARLEPRRAAGEVPSAEIDMLAFEIVRAEQALALAEAEVAATLAKLRGRLRLPPEEPLALALDLAAVLARPLPGDPAVLETVRPTLALAAQAVRQAEAALELARAETRGDWTVGGGFDFERRANDYTGRLEHEPRLSVSASVPWPRGVANRGEIREKQAALRLAETQSASLRDEVRAEIAATGAVVRALQPVLLAQRRVIEAAGRPSDSLQAAYSRGEVPGVQLVQARQQRLTLETEFLHAAARYAAALADAETAVGLLPVQP